LKADEFQNASDPPADHRLCRASSCPGAGAQSQNMGTPAASGLLQQKNDH